MVNMTPTAGAGGYLHALAAQAGARAIAAAANLIALVMVARICGAADFGQLSYALSILAVAVVLAEFGTTGILPRLLVTSASRGVIWSNYLFVRLLAALAVTGVGVAGSAMLAGIRSPVTIGFLFLPFIASRTFDAVFQIHSRPWVLFWCSALYAAVYLVAIAALGDALSPTKAIATYGVANMVYAFAATYMAMRYLKPEWTVSRDVLRSIVGAAAPVGVSSVFATLNARVPVILLAHLAGDAAVGLFSAAGRFVELAAIMAVTAVQPLVPIAARLAEHDPQALHRLFRRVFIAAASIAIPVAIATPYFAPSMLTVVFGPEFAQAGGLLSILVWAAVIGLGCVLGSALCLAAGVVRFGYWNTSVATLFNIVLCWILIQELGIHGAAVATVATESLLLTVIAVQISRRIAPVLSTVQLVGLTAGGCTLALACLAAFRLAGGTGVGVILVGYAVLTIGWMRGRLSGRAAARWLAQGT
jgi:PST family polysaccharide transporter